MSERPNILLVMSDQHNAKCAGFAGHPIVQTPSLDRLAARGVRLTSAYAQNPICTPSRMCHLTGQYAHNHGYYGLAGPLPPRLPSLFSELKRAGYHTGAIGKIHLPDGWIEPHTDFFHYWKADERLGIESHRDYVRRHGYEHTDDEVTRARRAAGIKHQGLDGRPDFLPRELSQEGYMAHLAGRFLRERPSDRPFFLWYTLPKPHQLYTPAREFWDLYPDALPMPPSADDSPRDKILPMRRTVEGQRRNPPAEIEPKDYESLRQRKLRGYYGNISHMDWAVGELTQALDALGLREETIIVYTSDHGDFACEHGILEKAPGISSDAIGRVPMIWSWPGRLPEGETRDPLVESIDIWPTLARLAGLPAMAMWDGRDIGDVLLAGGPEVRDAAYTENPFLKCVTTREWRMTFVPDGVFEGDPIRGELYDRQNDPWERRNRFHDPACDSVVRALKDKLLSWLMTSTRPVNAHPVLAHPALQRPESEHVAGNAPYPEDGKTALSQVRAAVEEGRANYL